MKKRLIPVLLVLAMLLTLIPAAAVPVHADGVSWSVSADGTTITFSGNGVADIAYQDIPSGVGTIVLNEGITDMGEELLYEMNYFLRVIYLPASFSDSSKFWYNLGPNTECLGDIHVAAGHSTYKTVDGVLLNKAGTRLLVVPPRHGSVQVPDGVQTIAYEAFYTVSGSVTIPGSVSLIENYAFSSFSGEVTFLGSAPTIERYAFQSYMGKVTAYYPSNNATWTADMLQDYGAESMTWIPYVGEEQEPQWIQDSYGWKYMQSDGSYYVDCWAKIDGKWYHFDEQGYRQTGLVQADGAWYYMNESGVMQTGWKKLGDEGQWYYFAGADGGAMATGWKKIGSRWYYFDLSSGAMQTGWQTIEGKHYYFEPGDSGNMVTGWKKLDGKWYYFDTSSGIMQTGWQKIAGRWYYFDASSGVMQTGWQKISGKWYYFELGNNGQMVTGWKKIDGVWYYFVLGDNGKMVTGWKKIDGSWYYFLSGGDMVASKSMTIDGTIYHFSASGACTNR